MSWNVLECPGACFTPCFQFSAAPLCVNATLLATIDCTCGDLRLWLAVQQRSGREQLLNFHLEVLGPARVRPERPRCFCVSCGVPASRVGLRVRCCVLFFYLFPVSSPVAEATREHGQALLGASGGSWRRGPLPFMSSLSAPLNQLPLERLRQAGRRCQE